jgi:hypothetical protein
MARIRSIKPEFFTDADLGECSPLARILFAGLWCYEDRLGRVEDKPRELKIQVLPWDDCDVDALLWELHEQGLIVRYEVDGKNYIYTPGFIDHQKPHKDEKANPALPDPSSGRSRVPPPRPGAGPGTRRCHSHDAGASSPVAYYGSGERLLSAGAGAVNGDGGGSTAASPSSSPEKSDDVAQLLSASSPETAAMEFYVWFQEQRSRATGHVREGPPRDVRAVVAWFGDAVRECGSVERLCSAAGVFVLEPPDPYWAERLFPFAGFMSDTGWRKCVPPMERDQ